MLEALWGGRNPDHRIRREAGCERSRALFAKHGLADLNDEEFEKSLGTLTNLECIELDGDEIWLREWYRKTIS